MQKRLLWYGEDILRTVSEEIIDINDDIKSLIDEMFETMKIEYGIGLAAIQIGVPKRVLVVDVPYNADGNSSKAVRVAMINPEIIEKSDELYIGEEGCLSVPEIREDVARSKYIKVLYTDVDGKEHVIEAIDLIAKVIQHEMDHLDGILFIDRIEEHHKRRIKKDLRDLKRESKKRMQRYGE